MAEQVNEETKLAGIDDNLTTQASALASDSEAVKSARSNEITDLNKLRSERQAFKE